MICAQTDGMIAEKLQLTAELARQQRMFEEAPGFIAILRGPDHVFEFVNTAYLNLTGDRGQVGKPVREALPELDGQGFFEKLDAVYATGKGITASEVPISLTPTRACSPEERFISFVYAPITELDGTVGGIFVEGQDVTEAHKAKLLIEHLAYHDQLTGLQNRRRFLNLMDNRLEESDRPFALLLIDVDHLKTVNDTLGHAIGDALLKAIAERLSVHVSPHPKHACRIGGDEFAVLIDDCQDHATLQGIAEALLKKVRARLYCNGITVDPQVTIGGVVAGADGRSAQVLRQNADYALYHAKDICRGSYVRFDSGMRSAIARRIATIKRTAEALSEGRLIPHYQPLVRLDTGRIIGLEALARIALPNGEIATAESFRDSFFDPSVSTRITDAMLGQVTRDMRHWLDSGIEFEHVGVNISPVDFRRSDIEERICNAFLQAGVPLKHLVVEITESVLMDDPRGDMRRVIKSLRKMGAVIALDDFGTGFASFKHLISLPVNLIKLDKSFIDRLTVHRPSAIAIESMIDIALKMGLKIVAEGVSSREQSLRLIELGCILGQGHCFAKAADAKAIVSMIKLNHASQARSSHVQ